jgi:hypothetical protein
MPRDRMADLSEADDRGAARKYGPEHDRRILVTLDQAPPPGYSNWTAPLLARELVDVHEQYIWRFLRAQKIDLSGRKSWCVSTDPEFVPKAADIVALYMSPPGNAVVLSVDEKPSIQALERAQGRRRDLLPIWLCPYNAIAFWSGFSGCGRRLRRCRSAAWWTTDEARSSWRTIHGAFGQI